MFHQNFNSHTTKSPNFVLNVFNEQSKSDASEVKLEQSNVYLNYRGSTNYQSSTSDHAQNGKDYSQRKFRILSSLTDPRRLLMILKKIRDTLLSIETIEKWPVLIDTCVAFSLFNFKANFHLYWAPRRPILWTLEKFRQIFLKTIHRRLQSGEDHQSGLRLDID